MNSGIFSSHFPPSEDPKIYPHNTLLFSLLLYQKEYAYSHKKKKNLSFLYTLHDASARDLLQ